MHLLGLGGVLRPKLGIPTLRFLLELKLVCFDHFEYFDTHTRTRTHLHVLSTSFLRPLAQNQLDKLHILGSNPRTLTVDRAEVAVFKHVDQARLRRLL